MSFTGFLEISEGLDSKPFLGVGSKFSEELFTAAGQATAMFERIQDEVIILFDQLCGAGPGERSKMATIIGATSSFNVKIDLVQQAATTFIENETEKKAVLSWIKLCKKAAEIRNKIAHGQAISIGFVYNGESKQETFWAPSSYDTKKVNFPNKSPSEWAYCWNEQQIREYTRHFHALTAMLMTVREELAGIGDEPMPQILDPNTMIKKSDQK